MAVTEQDERELRMKVMAVDLELKAVDIELKAKQSRWETPRNLAIVIGTSVAICTGLGSALSGIIAYRLGQNSSRADRPLVIQLVQPPAAGH